MERTTGYVPGILRDNDEEYDSNNISQTQDDEAVGEGFINVERESANANHPLMQEEDEIEGEQHQLPPPTHQPRR